MKKWLVILTVALLLTGCDKKQETDAKEESPKQTSAESVEEATEEIEETEASEESVTQTEESAESVETSTEAKEYTEVTDEDDEEEEEEEDAPVSQPEDIFPNSSEEEIPDALLEGLSADNLSAARYEIFKRHGRYFDESVLNSIEIKNIEKIKAVEGRVRLEEDVLTKELVSLHCYTSRDLMQVFYAYIQDGDLYYYYDETAYFIADCYVGQMRKYSGLNNIKRMITLNKGSGVDPVPCLITEDGEVYWFQYSYSESGEGDEGIILGRDLLLEEYQVEDILYYSGDWQEKVEVLLKDGSIIYLESEPWG
ncbi:MAG: hypothetical protein IKJ39_11075 [Lachnospiraceae bacterium]|nr:hypothetical protein [Lachnospiraceae bacterium]